MKSGELKGVEGWLAFLVVVLCAISPILTASDQYFAFQTAELKTPALAALPMWGDFQTYLWCVLGSVFALRLFAGYRLTNVFNQGSVWITIAVLFAAPLLQSVGAYFALNLTFGHQNAEELQDMAVELTRGWVAATIWTAYLLRSRRVSNTYGIPRQHGD